MRGTENEKKKKKKKNRSEDEGLKKNRNFNCAIQLRNNNSEGTLHVPTCIRSRHTVTHSLPCWYIRPSRSSLACSAWTLEIASATSDTRAGMSPLLASASELSEIALMHTCVLVVLLLLNSNLGKVHTTCIHT